MISTFLSTLPANTIFGVVAGIITGICALLIGITPRYKSALAIAALIIITPLAIGGFWFSEGKLGISDWDYYFSYHHTMRESLLNYGTFPQWNPYTCGGTAALGDPEFPVFTLTFLLELLFGVPTGFRLAIFLSIATGAIGTFFLARKLNLSHAPAFLAAIAATFGSVTLLEIVEGHPNVLSAMWIPWIFYAWYHAYQLQATNYKLRKNSWILLCGLFLTLTFYASGIYLLMYTAAAFIILILLAKNKVAALTITTASGVVALGLSAIKLIPVMLWLREFQDKAYASSTYTLPYLYDILLGRHLHTTAEIIPDQGSGWHEYGAYVGPFVVLLAFWGFITHAKHRIVRILGTCVVLALLLSSSGPVLKPFFDQASFLPRSNISRTILFAIIPLSLLAGFGLEDMRRRISWKVLTSGLIITIVAIDLMSLSYPLSRQAFILPDVIPLPSPAPSPIAYIAHTYTTRHEGIDYTRAYAAVRQGYGSLSYCSVLSPSPAVRTIHDEVDTGILSVKTTTEEFGTWQLVSWGPNRVKATISLPAEGKVILNANYAKGWYVNDEPASEMAGRVGTALPAGNHHIVFEYKAPGFVAGIILTLLTLVTLPIYFLIGKRYQPSTGK